MERWKPTFTKTVAKVFPDYLVETGNSKDSERSNVKSFTLKYIFHTPPKVVLEFDKKRKPVIVTVGDSS